MGRLFLFSPKKGCSGREICGMMTGNTWRAAKFEKREEATMFQGFSNLIDTISGYMYSYILIILLLAAGLYFTIRSGFVQLRLLPESIRVVSEKPKGKNSISAFQALMVSTASRVGTGNIVGVASAIATGGYGAVFWMWIIALVGGASAFVESTLARSTRSGTRRAAATAAPPTTSRPP